MIFTNTKRGVSASMVVSEIGIPAAYTSGDLPQKKRLRIIDAMKSGTSLPDSNGWR